VKVLVCVKRVPITGGKIVLTEDERAIDTRHLGFTVSPHEECGVEEAVRMAEAGGAETAVMTLGPPEAEDQLREALALGVDRAIHLVTDGADLDPEQTAAALTEAIRDEAPDLVIFGNESADNANHQVGIRVAHALGRPCLTGLKGLALEDGERSGDEATGRGRIRGEQETATGRDVYRVPLPAVVTVREGLNLPRYPSVPAKLRARRKPVERREVAAGGARLEMVRLAVPEGGGQAAEVLGEGPEAAPAVVDVLVRLGLA
jgi:electron transfer flavoprotein beta subunit